MINVAIDGPAGAGKSTISRAAAKKLGFIYVDTGALYRTVGFNALKNKIDTKDSELVSKSLNNIKIELKFINGEQRVYLNNEDVSSEIRTPDVSMAASDVSAIPSVREFLFDLQRNIAKENNCIMDGRDIGTVVLPDAKIKIFLTASAQARAKRRFDELAEKGIKTEYEDVLSDIKTRDYNDSHRAIAPLKQSEDAIMVDTTNIGLKESIELLTSIIEEHM